jgi:hypothetical protein
VSAFAQRVVDVVEHRSVERNTVSRTRGIFLGSSVQWP